jgi:hypothetical protein
MWHLVGGGTPRGAAGPSPGLAAAGSGLLRPAVVRPSLAVVRPNLHHCFGAPLYGSFVYCYSHIYVPTSKNSNKARGTLLVLKMCMMFVISSSHS